MLFFTLSNINIQFAENKFYWRFYPSAKALPITKFVKIINKKEFVKMTLDENSKTFLIYISAIRTLEMTIHASKITQIISNNPV